MPLLALVLSALAAVVPACKSAPTPPSAAPWKEGAPDVMTIDRLVEARYQVFFDDTMPRASILAHVVEWHGFPVLKRFTEVADREFTFEADGLPPIRASCGTGGISNESGSIRFIYLSPTSPLVVGARYSLSARNQGSAHRWVIAPGTSITRHE